MCVYVPLWELDWKWVWLGISVSVCELKAFDAVIVDDRVKGVVTGTEKKNGRVPLCTMLAFVGVCNTVCFWSLLELLVFFFFKAMIPFRAYYGRNMRYYNFQQHPAPDDSIPFFAIFAKIVWYWYLTLLLNKYSILYFWYTIVYIYTLYSVFHGVSLLLHL